MSTLKGQLTRFIKWLKNNDNQFYLFCLALVTIPLMLIDFTNLFVTTITLIEWVSGIIVATVFWCFLKPSK